MTAKRFTLTNPKNSFQEMKCGIDDGGNTLTFNDVVDLLNEQHEKIQRLQNRLRKVYDDDYYLKEFIICVANVFASGNNGLSRVRYDMIVDVCNMDKTTLKECFK